jgi:hypothetical protein
MTATVPTPAAVSATAVSERNTTGRKQQPRDQGGRKNVGHLTISIVTDTRDVCLFYFIHNNTNVHLNLYLRAILGVDRFCQLIAPLITEVADLPCSTGPAADIEIRCHGRPLRSSDGSLESHLGICDRDRRPARQALGPSPIPNRPRQQASYVGTLNADPGKLNRQGERCEHTRDRICLSAIPSPSTAIGVSTPE